MEREGDVMAGGSHDLKERPRRSNSRGWHLPALLLLLVAAVLAVLPGADASPTRASNASQPIEHVVVILQENHSFDNVLGQLCIQDHRECNAASSGKNEKGETIPLTQASDIVAELPHDQGAQLAAMDSGKMDGWEKLSGCRAKKGHKCYTQYDPSQIPSLAALARAGAISDAYFSRDIVPSWGGHLDFFAQTLDGFVGNNPTHAAGAPAAGPGWGCDSNLDAMWNNPITHELISEPSCVPDKNGKGAYRATPVPYVPTVADRLEEAGRTWGIYGAVTPIGKKKKLPGAYKWAICPTFAECLDGPQKADMHDASQLFTDATNGTLPSFSIATPAEGVTGPTSQHNKASMIVGDNYIGEEVSAIQNGPDGSSTTIFIYYDDCGCFYDHVTPPAGLGIRLPLVMVSPYAKVGYTDHSVATNSSILAYMESIFGVAPVNGQDATAYDFSESFDYSQTPSAPFAFHPAFVPPASRNLHPPPDADGT
jgi:phospholipase C